MILPMRIINRMLNVQQLQNRINTFHLKIKEKNHLKNINNYFDIFPYGFINKL